MRLAGAHRPDVCLPASGWTQTADHGVRYYPVQVGGGRPLLLPFRHFTYARQTGGATATAAHVFYCLWEDRAAPEVAPTDEPAARPPTPVTRASRWDPVRDGRRHLGQQVLELALLAPDADAAGAERWFENELSALVAAPPLAGGTKHP